MYRTREPSGYQADNHSLPDLANMPRRSARKAAAEQKEEVALAAVAAEAEVIRPKRRLDDTPELVPESLSEGQEEYSMDEYFASGESGSNSQSGSADDSTGMASEHVLAAGPAAAMFDLDEEYARQLQEQEWAAVQGPFRHLTDHLVRLLLKAKLRFYLHFSFAWNDKTTSRSST